MRFGWTPVAEPARMSGGGAGVQRSEKNIPELKEVQEVAGPWTVTFDAAWVKPLPPDTPAGAKEVSLSFPVLTGWTQRAEDGIKAYGGLATYRTMLPLPPGIDQSSSLQLDLGTVKEMARVELNGRDLGVVWCPPWRVTIPPGLLKPAENSLVITVANLWSNRLAADASLPDEERLTQVGHGMQQAMQQRGLQSSGLLGPVRIMAEKQE